MKFSHTLSLNANPDWEKHYIDYASLKKVINEAAVGESGTADFLTKLLENVTVVREFYYRKLGELNQELAKLKPLLEKSASTLDLTELRRDDEGSPAPRRNAK